MSEGAEDIGHQVGARVIGADRARRAEWPLIESVVLGDSPDVVALWDHGKIEGKINYLDQPLVRFISDHGYPDRYFQFDSHYDNTFLARPYTHFVFLLGDQIDYETPMIELKNIYEATFRDVAAEPPRFSFVTIQGLKKGRLFCGPGVYSPLPDEKPVGVVEVRLTAPEDGEWVSPQLHCNGEDREASLYASQKSLFASTVAEAAPACFDRGRLAPAGGCEDFSFLLRLPDQNSAQASLQVQAMGASGGLKDVRSKPNLFPVADLLSADGVPLKRGSITFGHVRIRETAPTLKPYRKTGAFQLDVDGVILPRARLGEKGPAFSRGRSIKQSWLDLDDELAPVTGPLQARRSTLVLDRRALGGSRLMIYDWKESGWKAIPFGDRRGRKYDDRLKATALRLGELAKAVLIRRNDGRPLSHLPLSDDGDLEIEPDTLLGVAGGFELKSGAFAWSKWLERAGGRNSGARARLTVAGGALAFEMQGSDADRSFLHDWSTGTLPEELAPIGNRVLQPGDSVIAGGLLLTLREAIGG